MFVEVQGVVVSSPSADFIPLTTSNQFYSSFDNQPVFYSNPIQDNSQFNQSPYHYAFQDQPIQEIQPVNFVNGNELPSADSPELVYQELVSERSPVQPKEQILEEIVRECEEIERRSNATSSPNSTIWSSDETETYETTSSGGGRYKTPERRERKKAQNRLAATRYREKKRKEKESQIDQMKELLDKNGDLKKKVGDLQQEIHYLKKLMVEIGIDNSE